MKQPLKISRQHWQEMLKYVDQQAPLEACGMLAGKGDQVATVIPVRNRAQSPVRYVMDPYEQLRAFEQIEDNGLDLLAIFHSHPAGPATASPTDIAEAAYEVVHVIWSRTPTDWQARGFWIEHGSASEVSLHVVD